MTVTLWGWEHLIPCQLRQVPVAAKCARGIGGIGARSRGSAGGNRGNERQQSDAFSPPSVLVSSLKGWTAAIASSRDSTRSLVDLLLQSISSMQSGEGANSNGSVGLSVWGVVDRKAVAVGTAVADVQNSAVNLSATATKEGVVGTLTFVISGVNSMPSA